MQNIPRPQKLSTDYLIKSLLNSTEDPFILDITEILVMQNRLQEVYPRTCAATVASMKTKIIETHKWFPE